jgi:hypothetical protein
MNANREPYSKSSDQYTIPLNEKLQLGLKLDALSVTVSLRRNCAAGRDLRLKLPSSGNAFQGEAKKGLPFVSTGAKDSGDGDIQKTKEDG